MRMSRQIHIGFIIISSIIALVCLVQVLQFLVPLFSAYHGSSYPMTGTNTENITDDSFIEIINTNPHLTRLMILPSDEVTQLPTDLARLLRLETLHIEGAPLESLPPHIGAWTSISTLIVMNTGITNVPMEIGNLPSLKTLRLNNNAIASIPASIGNLTNLTSLDLRNNQITSLPEELKQLSSLRFLYLGGNPMDPSVGRHLQEALPNTNIYY